MTSHSRCAKDSVSCDTKFCLLREHRVSADVLLKNFVAAVVFSVSYFLNVVEEFRSCLSKRERRVRHFGLSQLISSYVFCMILAKFIELRTHLLIFDYS